MYGCSWDEETEDVDGFDEFGYDGEDFISLDLKNLRYITTKQEALITQGNWNKNKAFLEGKKQYRTQICIEWLKKYLQYGERTLKRQGTQVLQITINGSFVFCRCSYLPSEFLVYFN